MLNDMSFPLSLDEMKTANQVIEKVVICLQETKKKGLILLIAAESHIHSNVDDYIYSVQNVIPYASHI